VVGWDLKLDDPKAVIVKRLLKVPRKLQTMALIAPITEVASLNNNCVPSSESGLAPNMINLLF